MSEIAILPSEPLVHIRNSILKGQTQCGHYKDNTENLKELVWGNLVESNLANLGPDMPSKVDYGHFYRRSRCIGYFGH